MNKFNTWIGMSDTDNLLICFMFFIIIELFQNLFCLLSIEFNSAFDFFNSDILS